MEFSVITVYRTWLTCFVKFNLDFRMKPNNPDSPSTRVNLVFNMFHKEGLSKGHWLFGYWIGLWQLKKTIKVLTPVCYTYDIIFILLYSVWLYKAISKIIGYSFLCYTWIPSMTKSAYNKKIQFITKKSEV